MSWYVLNEYIRKVCPNMKDSDARCSSYRKFMTPSETLQATNAEWGRIDPESEMQMQGRPSPLFGAAWGAPQ